MGRLQAASRVALYALLALVPLSWAALNSNRNPRALVVDMVQGTAFRPYVYRMLAPWLVGAFDRVLPAPVRTAVATRITSSAFLSERLGWGGAHPTWYLWTLLIGWGSLVTFALAFQRLARAAPDLGQGSALAAAAPSAAALMLLLVPIHFGYQNFIYDFPELALFTVALARLAERKWLRFFLALALALLNKETSVLLIPVSVIWLWGREDSRRLAGIVALQLALAAGILLAIRAAFAHTPGEPVEFHLARNLHYRPSPRQLLHDGIYLAVCVGAVLGASRQPRAALAAAVVGGALLATMLFLGFLGEYRDFYEVFPLLGLLVAGALWRNRATPNERARPAR